MREPQQQQTPYDPEATLVVSGEETTLVSPRFDDEETLVARPVVPFENGAQAPRVAPPAPEYRNAHAPRRSRMRSAPCVGSSARTSTASGTPSRPQTRLRHQWIPYER